MGSDPRRVAAGLLAAALLALQPGVLAAQVFLTQDEALRLAFPEPATIERRTAFLDEDQLARARDLAGPGVAIERRVVTYYVGRTPTGETLGSAFFDVHRVRTVPEVLMIVAAPDGRLARIEILKFGEPRKYAPPAGWLGQFVGLGPGPELSLKGRIVNMTGASLTSRAVTRAARRTMALYSVISGRVGDRPAP
ncbi:MAG: FMN-binding protein [Gemmatimonadota bacterium]